MTTKPRTLNMEEKRKIEKLFLSDIESTEQLLNTKISNRRDDICEELEAKPSPAAIAAFKAYKAAEEQQETATSTLEKMGWYIPSYGNPKLQVNRSGTMPAALVEFDEQADAKRKQLTTLKRTYTLKLFAGEGEAQSLIETLAKELSKIVA